MTVVTILLCVLASFLAMILTIRRSLRQRPIARKFRDDFIALADDLVGKPDFPYEHACQLAQLAAVPAGWLTRIMVVTMFYEMVTGRVAQRASEAPLFDRVPENLRGKYAVAILTLALSDSYRCAIFGRVWRGANSWIAYAIQDFRPDVNAHATRVAVAHVNVARSSKPTAVRSFATAC